MRSKQSKTATGYACELPLLAAAGFRIEPIEADGNCLFRSLSYHVHGNQERHLAIRARIVSEMRKNYSKYKEFISINGDKTLPRRSKMAVPIDTVAATERQLKIKYEKHLVTMAKPQNWGDHMEIVAFVNSYGKNIRLWQADFTYVLSSDKNSEDQLIHILRHDWEHYSAVVPLDTRGTLPLCSTVPQRKLVMSRIQHPHDRVPHMVSHASQNVVASTSAEAREKEPATECRNKRKLDSDGSYELDSAPDCSLSWENLRSMASKKPCSKRLYTRTGVPARHLFS